MLNREMIPGNDCQVTNNYDAKPIFYYYFLRLNRFPDIIIIVIYYKTILAKPEIQRNGLPGKPVSFINNNF